MKNTIKTVYGKLNLLTLFAAIMVLAALMSFQDPNNRTKKQATVDSPPPSSFQVEIELKNLDETIKKSMEAVEKTMKEMDWAGMTKKINESMQKIDLAKMEVEMKKALNDVDWNKIKIEVDNSMKLDMDKMKLDMDKAKAELKLSMNINSDEIKKSMEELKKINFDDLKKEMEKVRKEMDLNKDQLKIELEKAKAEVENTKAGLREINEMVNEMEKDGIINKSESNSIEMKDKDLYINGVKQSPDVSSKYRKYFKGDNYKFKFSIEK